MKVHKFKFLIILFLFILYFSTTSMAFQISDIPDNTLKLGDDFYDMNSSAMSDPAEKIPIESLLKTGPNHNKAYFKFGGHWYEPFVLTAEQFLNPVYALNPEQVNAISGFNKWYKAGNDVVSLIPKSVTKVDLINEKYIVKGTSISSIGFPSNITITLDDSTNLSVPVAWNAGTPAYDPDKTGTYLFTGTLILSSEVTNPSNLSVSIKINVVQPVIDPNPATQLRTSTGTLIDECDSQTAWNSSDQVALEEDTKNKVSSAASLNISSTAAGGGQSFTVQKNLNGKNMSDMKNIEFNIFTPDVSQIDHIYVRIFSGKNQGSYFGLNIGSWRLLNGWNRIDRLVEDFSQVNSPSMDNITEIRITFYSNTGCNPSVNIDRIAYNVSGKTKVLFTFDDGWYDLVDNSITDNAYSVLAARGFKATTWVNKSAVGSPGVHYILKDKSNLSANETLKSKPFMDKMLIESAGNDEVSFDENSGPKYLNETDLNKLYSAGWDIGNHTVNHLDSFKDDNEIQKEYGDNQEWLLEKGWKRGAYHVAYPSGIYNERIIEILQKIGVLSARTTVYGLQAASSDNIYKLKCIYLDSDNGVSGVEQEIDRAVQTGCSVMFMFHKIENTGDHLANTTSDFKQIVEYVYELSQKGKIEVSTVSEWYNAYIANGGT